MLKKITNVLDKFGNYLNKIGEWIYKYRYIIAVALFILCILFEISGSSIGMWKDYLNSNVTDDGVIFGVSRAIRTDEWAVLTPMMFSQKFSGFEWFSNILRGTETDVFMVYGLPITNLVQIFRPFQIGFLFLGLAKGLSFFWCGRFIALFLVTFEFMMLLTKKKSKLLALVGSVMITLAPMIQWWFAVNGIVEIFVFGELAVILLDKYMKNSNLKKRILYLIGMIICAGSYIMVMYPAWQIPMFFVFLVLAIWVIVENRKEFKINYKDVISIIVALVIFVSLMGCILYTSWDTIETVMNTSYPGDRLETGGDAQNYYINYIMNIFLPFKSDGLDTNQCEKATMFTLFPIGIIIALYVILKENKKDICLILLSIVYTILGVYCIFGFPELISKLTLLSNSQAKRAMLAVGFIDVLILIRAISIREKPFSKKASIIIAVSVSVLLVLACERVNAEYITLKMALIMLIVCLYLFYFALRYNAKYANYLFALGIIVVMLVAGFTVNPIRSGVDVITDSEVYQKVEEIAGEDDGLWIVEGDLPFMVRNYLIMAGASTINSTNTYPDLEKWYLLDEEKEYEDIYNRYAHIQMNLYENAAEIEEKFELVNADAFTVNLSLEDLRTLNVKYIFTINNLEEYETDEIDFELLYDNYGYKIYQINY